MRLGRRLIASSVARTAAMMVGLAVAFKMLPFLVAHLGDRWYGIWTIIGSLTGYYYLVDLGMAAAVTRYITQHLSTRDHRSANEVINTSLGIYAAMGAVIILLAACAAALAGRFIHDPATLPTVRVAILIIGLNLAIEFPFKAFAGIVGAYVRYDLLSYAHVFVLLLSTGLTVFVVLQGHGILGMAIVGLFSSQVSNLLFYFISRHLFPEMRVASSFFRKERVRTLFGYGMWAFLIQIGEQLRSRIHPLVIGLALSAAHVTHYFIGARLVELFLNLAGRATNILTPVFTSYDARGDREEMRSKVVFMTKLNAALAAFGAGLIILVGRPFITRWMGDSYLDAYPVMVTLALSRGLEIIQYPMDSALFAIARHDFLSKATLVEGVVNLGLSLLLVRPLGIWGVALGAAIPLAVTRAVVIPIFACRHLGIPLRQYYGSTAKTIVFTGAYLGLFSQAVQRNFLVPDYPLLLASVLLAAPLYAASILFFSFSARERAMIRSLMPWQVAGTNP